MRRKTTRPTRRHLDRIAAAEEAYAHINSYAMAVMPVCDMIIATENAIAQRHNEAFWLQRTPFHAGLIDGQLLWVDVEGARAARAARVVRKKKGTA